MLYAIDSNYYFKIVAFNNQTKTRVKNIMPFSSIALVCASAALAAVIFKDKDSRVKEIIDFAKLSSQEIESSVYFTIIKYDLNSYITGIKDNSFHKCLLDIMARESKPIGYFCKLEERLELNQPYYLRIKRLSWIQSLSASFLSKMGNFSHFMQVLVFTGFVWLSIENENSTVLYQQAFSIALSALAGFLLYDWFTVIALIWKQYPNSKDLKEYTLLFEKYAKEKRRESFSSSIKINTAS